MVVIFMKVAPYGCGDGKKKADLSYYASLAARRISPPLLPDSENFILKRVKRHSLENVKIILSSPQKRAVQTAQVVQKHFLPGAKIAIDKNLDEIPFSLDGADAKTYSSTIARNVFLHGFLADSLPEKRDHIKARIMAALMKARQGKRTLCVTHTFLMKLIETLAGDPSMFGHPDALERNFDAGKKLFEYCAAFELSIGKTEEILRECNGRG